VELALVSVEGLDSPSLSSSDGSVDTCRFDMADIAALTRCTSGGFMPHARHGGKGVRALAVEGSKLEGTGFEKEQMGHTHVALDEGADAGAGLPRRSGVLGVLLVAAERPRDSRLDGLGKSEILGEDFRKPA
jgi:hypothetical protein